MNPKTLQIELGKEIRGWRDTRELSLGALAAKARVSKGNLSKIENGLGNPTVSTVLRISKALRIGITDLLKDAIP